MKREKIRHCENKEVRLLAMMLRCIKRHESDGGATFIDLELNFKRHGYDYQGEYCCCMAGIKAPRQIIYWEGWRVEAFCLLGLLLEEKLIEKRYAGVMPYLDKGIFRVPVIQNINDMHQTGWLPILFAITKEGDACLKNS